MLKIRTKLSQNGNLGEKDLVLSFPSSELREFSGFIKIQHCVDVRLAIGFFDFQQSDIAVRIAVNYSCDTGDVCFCDLFGDS
jgi:hypothetical protein